MKIIESQIIMRQSSNYYKKIVENYLKVELLKIVKAYFKVWNSPVSIHSPFRRVHQSSAIPLSTYS